MIFPVLEVESVLQVNDKTRLDGRKTYKSPDEAAITLVEIEPEAGAGFFDVTTDLFLDWQYATDGDKVVSLRVTTDGGPQTSSKTITLLTAVDDKLFSSDDELVSHEPDILNYVRPGRNSFLNIHRSSQDRILTWLDEHRIWDVDGNRLTKDAIVDIEEVNDWSKFLTLEYIFQGLSNSVDDIFSTKAMNYRKLAEIARNRSSIRLDTDNDGDLDDQSPIDVRTIRMFRR
jgi:hypothetical protein